MTTKSRKTIFIVEDSKVERSMLEEHLTKYTDVEVRHFSAGEHCIRSLIMEEVEPPHLLLLDFFLDYNISGAKDGLDTLKKIKELYPEVKVVMLTKVKNQKVIEEAKKNGALDYVTKGPEAYKKLDNILKKHLFGLKKTKSSQT